MKKLYTVTNDNYSRESVEGTRAELQQLFCELGWNTKLEINLADDSLYDDNADGYPTVAELNS